MKSIVDNTDDLRGQLDLAALEAKWSKRDVDDLSGPVYLDDIHLDSSRIVETDPLKHFCSFCGIEVHLATATEGRRPRQLFKTEIIYSHGRAIGFEDKVIHISEKELACPNCVLGIKKVRFPETEG